MHDITPASAGWGYVGFGLYRLKAGESAAEPTGETEVILVLVEGKATVSGGGKDFGELGPAHVGVREDAAALRLCAGGQRLVCKATTDCVLAICTAPAMPAARHSRSGRRAFRLSSAARAPIPGISIHRHGRPDVADSLLVTEVFTPSGNWSSYPPHRHDEDNFPEMTYLEETYYHRLNPAQGFGFQRVFTEDGSLDETMAVSDGDVVLVPKGHHPCGVPHGYEMYYLNVMAGPCANGASRTIRITTGSTSATASEAS